MEVELAVLVSGSPPYLQEIQTALARSGVTAHIVRPPVGELNA